MGEEAQMDNGGTWDGRPKIKSVLGGFPQAPSSTFRFWAGALKQWGKVGVRRAELPAHDGRCACPDGRFKRHVVDLHELAEDPCESQADRSGQTLGVCEVGRRQQSVAVASKARASQSVRLL